MSAERSNLLLITTHDLSRRLGCYGHPLAWSPNLDRLAAEGTRFEGHYCHMSLCGPSRACIFTGTRVGVHQRWSNKVTPFAVPWRQRTGLATWPELLRRHGYTTAAIQTVTHDARDPESWDREWHTPHVPMPDCLTGPIRDVKDRPDRDFFSLHRSESSWRLQQQRFEATLAAGVDPTLNKNHKFWRGPAYESCDDPRPPYETDQTGTAAIDELHRLADGGAPFLLAVGFDTCHFPFCVRSRHLDRFRNIDIPLPACMHPPHGAPACSRLNPFTDEARQYYGNALHREPFDQPPHEWREMIRHYLAAIAHLDEQVGLIRDALETRGLLDNTIIVFTTDHGLSLGEHRHWGKQVMYDMDTQTPLIVRLPTPDTRRGLTVPRITEHIDLYPTMCDLLGLPTPKHCQGRSLATFLRGESPPNWKDHAIGEHFANEMTGYTIRTPRYRYGVWFHDPADTPDDFAGDELYDYQLDPHETASRVADSQYQTVVAELRQRLMEQTKFPGTPTTGEKILI